MVPGTVLLVPVPNSPTSVLYCTIFCSWKLSFFSILFPQFEFGLPPGGSWNRNFSASGGAFGKALSPAGGEGVGARAKAPAWCLARTDTFPLYQLRRPTDVFVCFQMTDTQPCCFPVSSGQLIAFLNQQLICRRLTILVFSLSQQLFADNHSVVWLSHPLVGSRQR